MPVDAERCRRYAVRQGLTETPGALSALEIVRRLGGLQDQIQGSSVLSLLARSGAVSPPDVSKHLSETRLLVRTWTIRGTMHVLAADDLPLYRAALLPEWETRWSVFLDHYATREQRRRAGEAALKVLEDGPLPRSELLAGVERVLGLREEWLRALFGSWGGVLKDLSFQGRVIHVPSDGPQGVFALTETWLGDRLTAWQGSDPAAAAGEALAVIAARYLAAYGPATVQDFAAWSGVTVARARQAFKQAGSRIRASSRVEGCFDTAEAAGDETSREAPAPGSGPDAAEPGPAAVEPGPGAAAPGPGPAEAAFLPKFDPYLLAHKAKFYLDQAHYGEVFRRAADVAATVVSQGEIIGTWRWQGTGKKRAIVPSLFGERPPALVQAVARAAEALEWRLRPA